MAAGNASRGATDPAPRTAPTVRPAALRAHPHPPFATPSLARPPACCTITPIAFTDPLPLLTYCYA